MRFSEHCRFCLFSQTDKRYFKRKRTFSLSEWKFWDNIDKFFNSGILSDDDKCKLIGKMSNEKEKQEVGRKIIDLIGKIGLMSIKWTGNRRREKKLASKSAGERKLIVECGRFTL